MEEKNYPGSSYQNLFNYLHEEHGLTLLESEMNDLINLVHKFHPAGIDREWICDALIEFTIAYIKSNNKDIANDAAEYLDDKLKEAGIMYVLSEDEQPAVGREEDAVAFAEWLRSNHHEPTFGNQKVNDRPPPHCHL